MIEKQCVPIVWSHHYIYYMANSPIISNQAQFPRHTRILGAINGPQLTSLRHDPQSTCVANQMKQRQQLFDKKSGWPLNARNQGKSKHSRRLHPGGQTFAIFLREAEKASAENKMNHVLVWLPSLLDQRTHPLATQRISSSVTPESYPSFPSPKMRTFSVLLLNRFPARRRPLMLEKCKVNLDQKRSARNFISTLHASNVINVKWKDNSCVGSAFRHAHTTRMWACLQRASYHEQASVHSIPKCRRSHSWSIGTPRHSEATTTPNKTLNRR